MITLNYVLLGVNVIICSDHMPTINWLLELNPEFLWAIVLIKRNTDALNH